VVARDISKCGLTRKVKSDAVAADCCQTMPEINMLAQTVSGWWMVALTLRLVLRILPDTVTPNP